MTHSRNRLKALRPILVALCLAAAAFAGRPAAAQEAAPAPAPPESVTAMPAAVATTVALPAALPPAPTSVRLTTGAATTAPGPMLPIDAALTMPPREIDEEHLSPFNKLLPEIITRFLRDRNSFIYDPRGLPDPMIIPWIRAEILNSEHIAQALEYLREAESTVERETKRRLLEQAMQEVEGVVKDDPTSKYGHEAQALKEKIHTMMEGLEATTTVGPVGPPPPRPPEWVVLNTKAVVIDQSSRKAHTALVGDSMLHVGDTVPKYPDVRIVGITRDAVTYEFKYDETQNIQFTVNVEVEVKTE